jgi:uncharacterized phage-associated protein
MVTVFDVANYFLSRANESEDSSISNLKLQKLIYYAQGYHLALFDEPFFPEDFEAWTHGPVCPAVYRSYKRFGAGPIVADVKFEPEKFSQAQLELLDEIQEVFGQFSAWKLRDMTHEDEPWSAKESTAGIIEKSAMRAFYKKRLN